MLTRNFSILICGVFLLMTSCSRNNVSSVARGDLWSMNIGRLEDEIDLYYIEGRRNLSKTAITMRGGFFYISNGNGQKIVRYNSFSDLLFMIYNEETNPPPITLRNRSESESVTRWSYPWPLRDPGSIAVNSKRNIYVEDKIPSERHIYDSENKALQDSVVLHFDPNGRFLEYLGQEGPGGRPFPKIDSIRTSVDDEIAVICHLPKSWNVYWFNSRGELLYLIPFRIDSLYQPEGRFGIFPSLDSITIAPDSRKILLKVDYYREVLDETTNTIAGREPDSSYIWAVNPETGECLNSVMLPFFESVSIANNKKITEKLFYSMFGAMNGDRVMLYFPVEGGYAILILPLGDTGSQRKGLINVSPEELQFCTFDVSPEGILSALLSTNYEARVVWWRTDKLL
ncbi:MAG: lipoprotein [Termitinemataceae bacterium]|nr:MAG: lipoprotein [Termitinemataceae bacterium]